MRRQLAVARAHLTEGASEEEVARWDKHHALTPARQAQVGALGEQSRGTSGLLQMMQGAKAQKTAREPGATRSSSKRKPGRR